MILQDSGQSLRDRLRQPVSQRGLVLFVIWLSHCTARCCAGMTLVVMKHRCCDCAGMTLVVMTCGRGGHSSLSGIRDWMCLLTRHTSCELVSPLVFMIFDNYLISLLIYWSHCWIIHGCDAAVSAPGTAQSFHFTDTPSAVYDACLDWVLLNFKLASRAVWLNIDHCDRFMRQENGLN